MKKYFWLKMPDNFFANPVIKKLRKIAGGDTYTIIYQKLLLMSVSGGGILKFEGLEDEFSDELALKIDEDADNVKVTLLFMQKHGLIFESENRDDFILPEAVKNLGKETESAERMRRHRLKQERTKALHCDGHVTDSDGDVTNSDEKVTTDIEIDIDIDIDKDLKRSSSSDTAVGGAEGGGDLEDQAQETTDSPSGRKAGSAKGKSRQSRVYDHGSKYYKAASWLKQKVMQNTKKKIREPTEANLQSWADTFRLMESPTADNLPWEEIKETLKWAVSDSFWRTVIQSADGFRRNYAKIVAESERKPPDGDDGPVYRDLAKYREDD